jgi:toxin ParE1/3/4
VPELREIGVTEYREVVRKPYRIVYFTVGRQVYVVAILDGRRDLEDLLARRLLR